jgi:CheY-like chemotaxis protein
MASDRNGRRHWTPEQGPPDDPRRRGGGFGLNVLIVEDDADTAASTSWLLCREGHQVRIALDGPSALEEVHNDAPDVVLLDIALPGMDGWQIAKHLSGQAAPKKPFFVAITGYGRPADRCRSKEAGIHLHLVKPVDPQYLLQVLRRFETILLPSQMACSSL